MSPSADNELRLVSRLLSDRDLKPALDRRINSSWFVNEQARSIWDYMHEHWSKYGEVPTRAMVRDVMPTVQLLNIQDSIEPLLDLFVDWRRRVLTIQAIQNAAYNVEKDEDHEKAITTLQSALLALEVEAGPLAQDINLVETIDERLENYAQLKDLDNGMRGIPTGFPTIDRATLGLQPGQLVTIVATPGVGKSTLAMRIAANAHIQGKVPLFVSFEMSNPEQEARHDAMTSGISHSHLLSGRLDDREEGALRRALNDLRGKQPFWLTADPANGTISGLRARAETHQPIDLMIVDGAYLMIDEQSGESNTPQALTNITRSMKKMAQSLGIPIIIATQALTWKKGRKGLTADSIGYSSSFFQDSDVILGLDWFDEEEAEDERVLKVMKSRSSGKVETQLRWDWTASAFEEV